MSNLIKNYPKPGEKYQHYKGGQYEVICMCNHTDTNEPLVVYRSISFGSQYARPLSEWYDVVDVVEFGGRKIKTHRFEFING
jgi:hypothetical protein